MHPDLPHHPCQARRGFSLLELLVTLLVAAIVLALAVPALGELVLNARRTANVNALIASIQLARSESAKRGLPVVVCHSADRLSCSGNNFDQGWLVFVNRNAESPPMIDAADTVLLAHVPEADASIRSNRPFYIFRPYFRRSTNGTVTFCDRRGHTAARAVVISYTGRPRVATSRSRGRALVCAG
jgi:type IV fimbrial biogenesis protein FimT